MKRAQKISMRLAAAAMCLLISLAPSVAFGPSLSVITATIANGDSVSGSIALGDDPVVAIRMPAAWTAAVVTFQVSDDGTTFGDLYNLAGDETTVQIPAGGALAGKVVALSPWEFAGARYIKIRSGTGASPVSQGAARTLTLITRINQ